MLLYTEAPKGFCLAATVTEFTTFNAGSLTTLFSKFPENKFGFRAVPPNGVAFKWVFDVRVIQKAVELLLCYGIDIMALHAEQETMWRGDKERDKEVRAAFRKAFTEAFKWATMSLKPMELDWNIKSSRTELSIDDCKTRNELFQVFHTQSRINLVNKMRGK
jgi:hypothetical protein